MLYFFAAAKVRFFVRLCKQIYCFSCLIGKKTLSLQPKVIMNHIVIDHVQANTEDECMSYA